MIQCLTGDPFKLGDRVVEAVESQGLFESIWAKHDKSKALRILLGTDCYSLFKERVEDLQQAYIDMAEVAYSANVDE